MHTSESHGKTVGVFLAFVFVILLIFRECIGVPMKLLTFLSMFVNRSWDWDNWVFSFTLNEEFQYIICIALLIFFAVTIF